MGWFDVAADAAEYLVPKALGTPWQVANTGYELTASVWDYATDDLEGGDKHLTEFSKDALGLVPILGDVMQAGHMMYDTGDALGLVDHDEDEQPEPSPFDWGGAGIGAGLGTMFGPLGMLAGAIGGGVLSADIKNEDDWGGAGAGIGGGIGSLFGPLGLVAGAIGGGILGERHEAKHFKNPGVNGLSTTAATNFAAENAMGAAMKAMGHYAD